MADRKISELTNITGANLADDDEFALVDTSADETKAITFGEFKTALDTATGFVRITGDTMTGNLTVPNVVVSGNVDGRDVSADGTKLDGIEAGADVTDATNVTAAGALMDSELANLAAVKAINQGLSTSDSPSFDAVTVGGTGDPSSEMTILSSIGGTSELRLGDTDADAGSIKYFNSNDQLVLRAAAATRAVFSSTGVGITGKTTTDELDLNAIAATISDTAVDIFVYDTRKDSDGGAWRKRTQHTSWYNEAASSTRGSRKEFPAVAVIVAESNQVTIYDGDDPDLPMWMVFNNNSGAIYYTHAVSCVSMLNGILTIGISSTYGVSISNFVTEEIQNIRNTFGVYTYNGSIVDRNSSSGQTLNSANPLVNGTVNDVAMTVLPNAPIDAATGLPVPTIAVATDGGVSVIKDDGTVVDITTTYNTDNTSDYIDFTSDNRLYFCSRGKNYPIVADIPSSDVSSVQSSDVIFWPSAAGTTSGLDQVTVNNTNVTDIAAATNNSISFGGPKGIIYAQNVENISADKTAVFAQITSDFNTGYQNGDIKLATLSDTDDTDVTGSELVTNGTFDTNTSGWTAIRSASISIDSARLKVTNGAADNGAAQQTILNLAAGTYVVSVEYNHNSSNTQSYLQVGTASDGSDLVNETTGVVANTATGTLSGTFKLSSTTTVYVQLHINGTNGANGLFDNATLRLAEEDRSVNGNGLQVFGTVTKTAVATGADLVAYSGFSSSNYLRQPYNSDLDFGTGDFCYIWWANIPTTTFQTHFTREHHNGSSFVGASIEVFSDNNTNKLKIFMSDDGFASYDAWASSSTISGMQCFAIVRQGNVIHTYIDGSLDNTHTISAPSGSMDNSDATLSVGVQGSNGSANTTGSIALLRASATVPSPEQIAKIYEDEKVLFQENAKATLYGSSDAVTALAYDDTTELLHVGTSAGRSVFQGLRRVDNTTTAVGAAISASNGLVADE